MPWLINNWLVNSLPLLQKKNCKMIAMDWSKEQALVTAPKTIQLIKFTGNIYHAWDTTMFFISEEAKETILNSIE